MKENLDSYHNEDISPLSQLINKDLRSYQLSDFKLCLNSDQLEFELVHEAGIDYFSCVAERLLFCNMQKLPESCSDCVFIESAKIEIVSEQSVHHHLESLGYHHSPRKMPEQVFIMHFDGEISFIAASERLDVNLRS